LGQKQTLSVPGRYDQVSAVCAFVAEGARRAGLGDDAVFHVELCCDEAVTNIIEHAYGAESAGDIAVSFETTDEAFVVTLHDNGRSFNPNAVSRPHLPINGEPEVTTAELIQSLQVGGLGIYFMRNLMDDVQFNFDPLAGNTLILIKRLGQVTDS
jgi:serine/threonine-protein kinase RsbW